MCVLKEIFSSSKYSVKSMRYYWPFLQFFFFSKTPISNKSRCVLISRNSFLHQRISKNSSNWTKSVKVVLYQQTISRNKIKCFKVDFPNFRKFLQIQQKKWSKLISRNFPILTKKDKKHTLTERIFRQVNFFILFYKR